MRPPFPTQIDASARAAFAACPRKFFFNYLLRKAPRGESVHLVFGGAMAKGLEVTRRKFYEQGAALPQAIDAGHLAIVEFWVKSSLPEEPAGTPKTLYNCIKALTQYFQHFNPTDDYVAPRKNPDGTRAVEFTFAVPLPDHFPKHPETGLPILYTGRFDALMTTKNGLNFICDDKTTSQLGTNFSKSMKMRSQFTGYKWACDQFNIPTAGVLVRAICAQKTQIQFAELTEMRPDHLVHQWLVQLEHDLRATIRMWEEDYFSPNLDDSCGSYGGCPYLDACLAPQPLEVLNDLYADYTWDPLAKQ